MHKKKNIIYLIIKKNNKKKNKQKKNVNNSDRKNFNFMEHSQYQTRHDAKNIKYFPFFFFYYLLLLLFIVFFIRIFNKKNTKINRKIFKLTLDSVFFFVECPKRAVHVPWLSIKMLDALCICLTLLGFFMFYIKYILQYTKA